MLREDSPTPAFAFRLAVFALMFVAWTGKAITATHWWSHIYDGLVAGIMAVVMVHTGRLLRRRLAARTSPAA